MRWATFGARLALGAVFVAAALGKLQTPASFTVAVAQYQLLPAAAIVPVARTLPWLELMVGLYLVVGLFTRLAAAAALGLLAIFALAIILALVRGLSLEGCGCFGSLGLTQVPVLGWFLGGPDAGPQDLIRDAVLAGLALALVRGPATPLGVDRLLFASA